MLTLPPEVGRKYRYRNVSTGQEHICEITHEATYRGDRVFHSTGPNSWMYWEDGEAKTTPGKGKPVAVLIEDVLIGHQMEESEELKRIRETYKRYKNGSTDT